MKYAFLNDALEPALGSNLAEYSSSLSILIIKFYSRALLQKSHYDSLGVASNQ